MMNIRKAVAGDLELLVDLRMEMLHAVITNGDEEQWKISRARTEQYYREAIESGEHIAYLAFDGERCVGTGGICFYRVLPTYYKPTGEKSYIINMYTHPEYRRQGIASEILRRLVADSLSRKVAYISLEATEEGKKLYEKCGFGYLRSEMQYINETYEG